MSQLIYKPQNLTNYLNAQRRQGQFCDVSIEIESGEKVFGHFCIIGAQSDFIGSKNLVDSYFSIKNPLRIKIQDFNCVQCLNTIGDFFYSECIEIPPDHEEHFKYLGKVLLISNLNAIFENSETLNEFFEDSNQEVIVETISENTEKVNFYRIEPAVNQSEQQQYSKLQYCPGCTFKCQKPTEMVSHLSHCNSDNMICSLCDIGFYSADDFYVHLVNHENPKAYYCIDCEMRFSTKTGLLLHMPKHSLESPYKCLQCPKRFKWKQTLTSHMLTHLNEKKLLCDVCGYSTIHMKALKSHSLTHVLNGKQCTFPGCKYVSSRRENLKIHMDTHKNIQPFICEICGKKFSQCKNYKRHALIHSEKTKETYKCTLCSFGCSRSDKLKEHINKNHENIGLVDNEGKDLNKSKGERNLETI